MAKIDSALRELRDVDELSNESSFIHSLNPLVKLIMTIAYIAVVLSFGKYELSRLFLLLLYPVLAYEISNVSLGGFFVKLRFVLPLVLAVGVLNPFFDRAVMIEAAGLKISGGVISMITLLLKGVYSLMASYLLIATTKFDAICGALRKLHVPSMLVTLMLLTYRYIFLMMNEVSVMTTAYSLRAPGQKGISYKAWGSFLGQLLLRSMDRATELYQAMRLRGFNESYEYAYIHPFTVRDLIFMLLLGAFLLLSKLVDFAALLGGLII